MYQLFWYISNVRPILAKNGVIFRVKIDLFEVKMVPNGATGSEFGFGLSAWRRVVKTLIQ